MKRFFAHTRDANVLGSDVRELLVVLSTREAKRSAVFPSRSEGTYGERLAASCAHEGGDRATSEPHTAPLR